MTMTYDDILKQYAAGKSRTSLLAGTAAAASTAATVNSGSITLLTSGGAIGTTYPSTIVGMPDSKNTTVDMIHTQSMFLNGNQNRGSGMARFYRVGTLNLTTTGDQFTHDSATFPLLRKIMGQTSQPLSLIPVVQVTTATSVTAPVIRLATAGGAAGYTDQDGNATIGNIDFTFPAIATAVNSWYTLRLNTGDWAVRDINQIRVITASTTGAATIWLMEVINPVQSAVLLPSLFDPVFGSAFMPTNVNPAVATTGTATSLMLGIGHQATSETKLGFDVGVEVL
jgi:hypothetical protein